jgi:MOSC domain-containing protein YiiM
LCASVVSVNIGEARTVEWQGRKFATGIFKTPVNSSVRVETLGIRGDIQADLTVHGGKEKAVYAYPSEHYEYWKDQLQARLRWGMFGENLTTQGLLEESVHTGDRFQVGSAELVVTRPRFPCYKLGMKFGSVEIVKRFQLSGRSGFYLAVLKEGDIAAGNQIRPITLNPNGPTVSEMFISDQ